MFRKSYKGHQADADNSIFSVFLYVAGSSSMIVKSRFIQLSGIFPLKIHGAMRMLANPLDELLRDLCL